MKKLNRLQRLEKENEALWEKVARLESIRDTLEKRLAALDQRGAFMRNFPFNASDYCTPTAEDPPLKPLKISDLLEIRNQLAGEAARGRELDELRMKIVGTLSEDILYKAERRAYDGFSDMDILGKHGLDIRPYKTNTPFKFDVV